MALRTHREGRCAERLAGKGRFPGRVREELCPGPPLPSPPPLLAGMTVPPHRYCLPASRRPSKRSSYTFSCPVRRGRGCKARTLQRKRGGPVSWMWPRLLLGHSLLLAPAMKLAVPPGRFVPRPTWGHTTPCPQERRNPFKVTHHGPWWTTSSCFWFPWVGGHFGVRMTWRRRVYRRVPSGLASASFSLRWGSASRPAWASPGLPLLLVQPSGMREELGQEGEPDTGRASLVSSRPCSGRDRHGRTCGE